MYVLRMRIQGSYISDSLTCVVETSYFAAAAAEVVFCLEEVDLSMGIFNANPLIWDLKDSWRGLVNLRLLETASLPEFDRLCPPYFPRNRGREDFRS